MTPKVSSSKGKSGTQKSGQKYQNSFAFKPNKNNAAAVKIYNTPAKGICQRCLDIIDWRKRMNKYKPLTQPKTCLACHQKRVTDAYHVLCKGCAETRKVCAKCQEGTDIVQPEVKTPADLLKESQEQQRFLAAMTERQRRSYLRKMERGDEDGAKKIVVAAENNDDGGWSDFDDDEEDEEEEDEE
ncbi:uncharacterized protein EV422DRAFT_14259 [Fimicolochytrium jonesii]|uniref:uncharacterized protein n=1 Tax=Fimicolochytrium jonesii TaxID=1396493 RepID=UPI0022FDED77|nr:uncharacterized protein EV422DRAFT_14259 [Fimicolochytrium jonesii]KAI8826846.1 hypothetical protein EV422DRAFT_14259 [Fimicolochytrium jonesii]